MESADVTIAALPTVEYAVRAVSAETFRWMADALSAPARTSL